MSVTGRLATSLTVLLVMLGLPVAPVLCDLVCPQAAAVTPQTPRHATVASWSTQAPCHEAAVARAAAPVDDGSAEPSAKPLLAVGSSPVHGCDHPVVVASRGFSEGFRLLAPLVALDGSMHLEARQAPHARIVRLASAAARPPGPSGAFSPILRI